MIEIICKPVLHFTILPPVFLFGQMSQSCYEQVLNLDEAHSRIIFQTIFFTSEHSSLFPVFRLSIGYITNLFMYICTMYIYTLYCTVLLTHICVSVLQFSHIYWVSVSVTSAKTVICFSAVPFYKYNTNCIVYIHDILSTFIAFSVFRSKYIKVIFVSVFLFICILQILSHSVFMTQV